MGMCFPVPCKIRFKGQRLLKILPKSSFSVCFACLSALGPHLVAKLSQDGGKVDQDSAKMAQDSAKMVQDSAKMAQDSPT
jgi:hypothetical protein